MVRPYGGCKCIVLPPAIILFNGSSTSLLVNADENILFMALILDYWHGGRGILQHKSVTSSLANDDIYCVCLKVNPSKEIHTRALFAQTGLRKKKYK